MNSIAAPRLITLLVLAFSLPGCWGGEDSDAFENARLAEGHGAEPDLVIGVTTLTEARLRVEDTAATPSAAGPEISIDAGPFRLLFMAPDTGGEPLLQAIRTAYVPNPEYPLWKGQTAHEIGLLDSEEEVRGAYGHPAAEWHRSFGGRALYYPSGLVVVVEHPTATTGYDGPPPTPTSANVTELWITVPFQILEDARPVGDQQRFITTPPRTTLRFSPF